MGYYQRTWTGHHYDEYGRVCLKVVQDFEFQLVSSLSLTSPNI